ncbi:MAG TPA: M28 family peptidase [Vicinamibacterales bacterium]|nr:M28 family peptidase [Vicinamibacterales bacterium]
MSVRTWMTAAACVCAATAALFAQGGAGANQQPAAPQAPDPIQTLVSRLELEKYKATLKGLTQFGDRRQGTQRNRDAVDWIQKQLESYGYTNAERITYDPPIPTRECGPSVPASVVKPAPPRQGGAGAAGGAAAGAGRTGGGNPGGGRGGNAGRGLATGAGGSRMVGNIARTGVNCDPMAQPDERIRALDSGPIIPGQVDEVYVTKIGTKFPNEMYIIGAHMDGHGYNEAVNDDGSGTALVMELARVFADPSVETERSIRFALWNGEEGGLNGARAYIDQRQALQGIENPPGSGKYPEPKWLGMIQHDMMMWDHGMPQPVLGPDGKPQVDANGRGVFMVPKEQRPEADVNVEFQIASKFADESMKLAFAFKLAGEKYATDYPVNVGPHMTNTDSGPFQDIVPAISLRENERGAQTGAGWNPTWHTPLDVWTTFTDKDFRLGLNAAQTTLAAIAGLTGAKIK